MEKRRPRTLEMENKEPRTLASEVPKTLNNLKKNFFLVYHSSHKKCNLYVPYRNTCRCGDKSIRAFGAHVWNSLIVKLLELFYFTFLFFVKLCGTIFFRESGKVGKSGPILSIFVEIL